MSLRRWAGILAISVIVINLAVLDLRGQEAQIDTVRRAKTKVEPSYPELARKMNITGTVKVEIVVSPSGVVKDAKVLGGHPLLANAALDAVRKWRFEPGAIESTGIVDFKFEPRR